MNVQDAPTQGAERPRGGRFRAPALTCAKTVRRPTYPHALPLTGGRKSVRLPAHPVVVEFLQLSDGRTADLRKHSPASGARPRTGAGRAASGRAFLVRTLRTVGHTSPPPGLWGGATTTHQGDDDEPQPTESDRRQRRVAHHRRGLPDAPCTRRNPALLAPPPRSGAAQLKVGRWVRYRRGDVRAWINAKRRGTAAN